jgi:preprotein translocase subunit SecG
MTTILLIVHLFVTLAMIGVVLIQRSEGGGLGIGSSQGMGSFMGGRGTANLLTRTTAVLATLFMVLSLTLALLNRGTSGAGHSVFDVPPPAPAAAPAPAAVSPPAPAESGAAVAPAPTHAAPEAPASENAAPSAPAPVTPPAATNPPTVPKAPSAPVD